MANRKKDMDYITMWSKKEETDKLVKLLAKPSKADRDFVLIGKILNEIRDRGDIKL